MDKILSKDEMNALLNSPAPAAGDNAPADASGIAVYNFRRPERFSKSVMQGLRLLHERFSTSAAASLSASFRTLTEVNVQSIEQSSFREFMDSLPDPTCLSALNMRPLQGTGVLELGPDIAFPLIDRLLGGAGGSETTGRKLTEIEKNVIRGVITLITTDLVEAWKPVTEISFQVHSSETRPQLLQVNAPNEVVIVVCFELRMGETRGTMHLCLPFTAIQPILGTFEQKKAEEDKAERQPDAADLVRVLRSALRAPIQVQCELPFTMVAVNDLTDIAVGDVLRLDNKIDDRVSVRIAGGPAFDATLLEVGGRKGAAIISRISD